MPIQHAVSLALDGKWYIDAGPDQLLIERPSCPGFLVLVWTGLEVTL